MSNQPKVSARVVNLIAATLAQHGHSSEVLMREAGLDTDLLTDPDARVSLDVEERLWDMAANRCGDPLLGLHAAERIRPGMFDVLDYVVRTAPDIMAALERLARYNRLLHDAATFELLPFAGGLRVQHRLAGVGRAACPHAAEFTMASLVVVGGQLAGKPVFPTSVEFVHAARGATDEYRRVLGVSPTFLSGVTAVSWPVEILQLPVVSADLTLSRIVAKHADQVLATRLPLHSAIAEKVRRLVAQHLADGEASLARITRELHMSERSLQRRLTEEGIRFADLVEEVRRALALRYVADGSLALGEVAYLLGYAEPSPFHRAFKRWTGMTPAAARRAAFQGRGTPPLAGIQ